MHRIVSIFFSLLLFLSVSCSKYYQPGSVAYKDYRISNFSKKDSAISNLLKPYSDSVNKSMNDIIIYSETTLEKKQPVGTLGNMMADAMLAEAKNNFKQPVDAAFINFGGIRLTTLAAGSITRGKIFELTPFDNIIVLLKVDGNLLRQFANHISGRGGWPVAGISWKITDKTASEIRVNDKPLENNRQYTIAMVDYVANGGDDCAFLKTITQINNGYVYRDALINYLSAIYKEGKKLSYLPENRITYAK